MTTKNESDGTSTKLYLKTENILCESVTLYTKYLNTYCKNNNNSSQNRYVLDSIKYIYCDLSDSIKNIFDDYIINNDESKNIKGILDAYYIPYKNINKHTISIIDNVNCSNSNDIIFFRDLRNTFIYITDEKFHHDIHYVLTNFNFKLLKQHIDNIWNI